MPETPRALPDFASWPSFPFEGDLRVKPLDPPVDSEPARMGEDPSDCTACSAPDEAYIYVNERWRVRAMDRPSGLPMVLILESRTHLDLGDLPNMLAAELGVMTVRLERAVRSLDGVARVHVNRWGDGSAHLHLWFLARPQGRLQLRGTFLSLWDDILPPISEAQWRENLALVAAWLAEFGGTPLAQPPRIDWKAPSSLAQAAAMVSTGTEADGEPTVASPPAQQPASQQPAAEPEPAKPEAVKQEVPEPAKAAAPQSQAPTAAGTSTASAASPPSPAAVNAVAEPRATSVVETQAQPASGKPARAGSKRGR